MPSLRIAKKTPLTFNIARLWGSGEGTNEKLDLDVKVEFSGEGLDLKTGLTGELMFIKLKDNISVIVKNLVVKAKFSCAKCLKEYNEKVVIPEAERQFFGESQKEDAFNDYYLIDSKAMTIDLNDMVRQEIILHFPLIPVCSKRCKGLCQYCGKDKNKALCKCKGEEIAETHKPFKNLKKLLS